MPKTESVYAFVGQFGMKIMLDMRKYASDIDRVCTALQLSAEASQLLLSLNQLIDQPSHGREIFIAFENHKQAIFRLEVSPEQNLIYTAEIPIKNWLQQLAINRGEAFEKTLDRVLYDVSHGSPVFQLF